MYSLYTFRIHGIIINDNNNNIIIIIGLGLVACIIITIYYTLALTFNVVGLRDQKVLESVGSTASAEWGLQRALVHGISEHEPRAPGSHGGKRRLWWRSLLDGILRQVAERLRERWRRKARAQGHGRGPLVVVVVVDIVVVVRGWRGVVRGREPQVPAPEFRRTVPGSGRTPELVRVRCVPVPPTSVVLLLQVGGQHGRVLLLRLLVPMIRSDHAVRVRGHRGTAESPAPVRLFGRGRLGDVISGWFGGPAVPLVPVQLLVRGRLGRVGGTAEPFAPVRLFGRRDGQQFGVQLAVCRRLVVGNFEQPVVVVPLVPPRLVLGGQAYLAYGCRRCGIGLDHRDRGSPFGRDHGGGDVLERIVHVLPVVHVLVKLARFADRRHGLFGRLVARL